MILFLADALMAVLIYIVVGIIWQESDINIEVRADQPYSKRLLRRSCYRNS